jgi:CubicO group peptidase (beta-lactamase class C family)
MSLKWFSICLKSSLLACFLLLLQRIPAQTSFSGLAEAIDARQKELGKDFVVMVWKKDDTLIYKKENGSYNSKTQANFGSAGKWLTTALVLVFVDEGKLSLDDKISQWLPEFARYGKSYITIRHCLTHYIGITDDSKFITKLTRRSKFSSLEDEVNSYAKREIRTNPGTDFWYGDMGFNIVGRILEVISKKNFDILAKQKLFNPLTMRRTTFATADGSHVSPAGNVTSTPDDYMKFLVMLMNKGKFGDKQMISESSIDEMLTIHTQPGHIKFAPKSLAGYRYTLGTWAGGEKNGKATSLFNPGFQGVWPMIDLCRGYALLIVPKEQQDEENLAVFIELKNVVDEKLKCLE